MTNIFDKKFEKLGDFLVPMTSFNQVVSFIEGCPDYGLRVRAKNNLGEDFDISDQMYCSPYPYSEPVSPDYYNIGGDFSGLSDEDLIEWRTKINDRAMVFANFALRSEIIERIDNDPNTGVIIELMCGYMIPFSYDKTNGLEIYATQEFLPAVLDTYKHVNEEINDNVPKEQQEFILKTIYADLANHIAVDKYRLMYQFSYTDHDPWNMSGKYIQGTANERSVCTLSHSLTIAKHVHECYNNHDKVILVM